MPNIARPRYIGLLIFAFVLLISIPNKVFENHLLCDNLALTLNTFFLVCCKKSNISVLSNNLHCLSKIKLLISLKKSFSKSFSTLIFLSMYYFSKASCLNFIILCTVLILINDLVLVLRFLCVQDSFSTSMKNT